MGYLQIQTQQQLYCFRKNFHFTSTCTQHSQKNSHISSKNPIFWEVCKHVTSHCCRALTAMRWCSKSYCNCGSDPKWAQNLALFDLKQWERNRWDRSRSISLNTFFWTQCRIIRKARPDRSWQQSLIEKWSFEEKCKSWPWNTEWGNILYLALAHGYPEFSKIFRSSSRMSRQRRLHIY